MKEFISKISPHYMILGTLLLIAAVSHGFNMFSYPYYENDEGAYMSQAWSLITAGKLAPYTYWYDHAPGGWILISIWTFLTGGFFTFGLSVNSGRVLMLVLHVLSAFFLFEIAKKLSGRYFAGIMSVLIFSLSPLAIYFQRRVLLDNMMIFWVLLALWILIRKPLKLQHVVLSAAAFGIAVLTKENAIFFFPAFLYVVYKYTYVANRLFAVVKWSAISLLIISLYFLYALLKGELLPAGMFGTVEDRVSLLTTLSQQAARGRGLPVWDTGSDLYINLSDWIKKDSFVMIAGIVASITTILLSIKVKSLRIPALFTALFWIFLLRGKLVLDFYIIPLIPFLALSYGMLIDFAANAIGRGFENIGFARRFFYYPIVTIVLVVSTVMLLITSTEQYTQNETAPQVAGYEWIRKNVTTDKFIAIDSFALVDLKVAGYSNAEWFWKVWEDPEIQAEYNNDWKKIDYLFVTHEMMKQMRERRVESDVLKKVYKNSFQIAYFVPNKTTFVDFEQYISTNGDWSAVYQLMPEEQRNLHNAGKYYKETFIKPDGQVVDPANGQTTSEGQSYAMLRSVWTNDQETFDVTWQWTQDHLQYRNEDKLFSWLWRDKVIDAGSASDADQDIALALLFAYKKWGDERYLASAQTIIKDIWKQEIVKVGGRYVLVSGTGAERPNGYLVNPSYFSPATYRIFAEVDTAHPWEKVADDSYVWLNRIGQVDDNTLHLPPNWVVITPSGSITPASQYISTGAEIYSYDAFRTTWRIALDAKWYDKSEAKEYLSKSSEFYTTEWESNKNYAAAYTLDGKKAVDYSATSTNAGPLSSLVVTDKTLANEVYQNLFEKRFNDDGFWEDKANYYDQNWAWFGTALYYDQLHNYWDTTSIAKKEGEKL
jgi:endo-1,4-beta-D-glucanase Y/4-amino-4-deoxy-L-arabinose transferase-like glycosyltransferase